MFKFFKKAISPVVATALLLVIAVISVVGFQGWFTTFSSGVFVDVETQTSSSNGVVVEGLVGEKLYVNSKGNSSINSIKINDVDCNFNGSVSGLDSVNISSCLENVSGSANIVVVTDDGIFESYKFVNGDVSGSSAGGSGGSEGSGEDTFSPIACSNNNAQNFYGGSGTLGDPYQICDCVQLQNMNSYLTSNFVLAGDIDCSMTTGWNAGAGFDPIAQDSNGNRFQGTLDGAGKIIRGLYISRPTEDDLGLISSIRYDNKFIKNLKLDQFNITGRDDIGSVLGSFYHYSYSGSIDNVYVSGFISGRNNLGGLVGSFKSDSGMTINKSYSNVTIVSTGNSVGGLVGDLSKGSILNSYSVGSVSGNLRVGGLIGYMYDGGLDNSFSVGSVTGTVAGGLVGYSYASVGNAYWDTQTSGQATSGRGGANSAIGGLTTIQMMTQASFVGWDFTNIWDINEGTSYPFLR